MCYGVSVVERPGSALATGGRRVLGSQCEQSQSLVESPRHLPASVRSRRCAGVHHAPDCKKGGLGFAIEVDGEAGGGIALHPQRNESRRSAEIGYWLGESFWGRGIMTEAVQALTEYGLQQLGLARIYAGIFESNPASCRVLEKAGYAFRRKTPHGGDKRRPDDR